MALHCDRPPLALHSCRGPVASVRLKTMPDQAKLDRQIAQLQRRATALHSKLEQASRAFVVELAGTPKSGKSTSVEAIRHFFKRHGFRVHVLTERADQCPIPMKGHLFFNTWCAASSLAALLANVDTPTDVIIVDRGLFDSLIWFQTQAKRGELSKSELLHIENFLLMDRWKDLFDLVVVLRASASIALEREHAQRITERQGSIMNPPMLDHCCPTHSGEHELVSGVRRPDIGFEEVDEGCPAKEVELKDAQYFGHGPRVLVGEFQVGK